MQVNEKYVFPDFFRPSAPVGINGAGHIDGARLHRARVRSVSTVAMDMHFVVLHPFVRSLSCYCHQDTVLSIRQLCQTLCRQLAPSACRRCSACGGRAVGSTYSPVHTRLLTRFKPDSSALYHALRAGGWKGPHRLSNRRHRSVLPHSK